MKTLKSTILVMMALFLMGGRLLAEEQVYPWKTFLLGMDPVSVSISHDGATLEPANVLKIGGEDEALKNSALAMAMGYCVFLNLTDLPTALKTAGADETLVNKIMMGENVNQWLATAWQESAFREADWSGYYQIDNEPWQIAGNVEWIENKKYYGYYLFLPKLKGGAVKPKTGEPKPILNEFTKRGFTWASVEKGYYEAISFLKNKTAYGDVPFPGFNFAEWAVHYAQNSHNTTHYPLKNSEHGGVDIDSTLGFEQIVSWMYNRGQFPFVPTDNAKIKENNQRVISVFQGKGAVSIQDHFPYVTGGDPDDPYPWGGRYVWQLPWLCTLLNKSKTIYSEPISANDVIATLETLKGFYNGAQLDKPDKVIEAAIEKTKALPWGNPYNSSKTFDSLFVVVKTMMEAAKAEYSK